MDLHTGIPARCKFLPSVAEIVEMADRIPREDEKCWEMRLSYARKKSQWGDGWGPQPGAIDCRVPKHMLQKGDGDDWKPMQR